MDDREYYSGFMGTFFNDLYLYHKILLETSNKPFIHNLIILIFELEIATQLYRIWVMFNYYS